MARAAKLLSFLLVAGFVLWLVLRAREGAPAPRLPTQSSPDLLAESPLPRTPEARTAAELPTGDAAGARQAAAPGAAARARVNLRLVDAATHEPAPRVRVELKRGPELVEALESDAAGLLAGRFEHEPGEYVLDFSSERHEGDLIQTRVKEAKAIASELPLVLAPAAPGAAPAELAIPLGPSYALTANWPGGLSPASFAAELRGADPRLAFDRVFAPVEEGPPAWVRFSPVASLLGGGPPWTVNVTSTNALWRASARVESVVGRGALPLALEFQPRARLVGRVVDPDGKAVPNQWVQAWLPGASFDDPARRPALCLTKADGSFDFRAIEPGRTTLKVEATGCLPFEDVLELAPLERVERELVLARPDPSTLAPIRGRLTSQSGRYDESLPVRLVPRTPPNDGPTTRVQWSGPPGQRVGRFAFEGLAPREYGIEFQLPDLAGVEPRAPSVRPGGDELAFVVEDGGARVDLELRAVSAEDRAPLQGWSVTARLGGARELRTMVALRHGEVGARVRRVPVGAQVELELVLPERRTLWTRVVASAAPEPLVFELARGWGAVILVQGPAQEALVGARVFLDEELAGTTDERGELRASLDHTPQRCRVEYKDWKPAASGEVSPETGLFRAWQGTIRARMQPPR